MAQHGETVLRAGDDNLLLAVGTAIEKLIPPTPPPTAPTCSGCSAIAGKAYIIAQAFTEDHLAFNNGWTAKQYMIEGIGKSGS